MKNTELNKGIKMIEEGLALVKSSVGAKAEEIVKEVIEGTDSDRRTELEAMKYNDLKALCSELGIKAVGKAPALVEAILAKEAEEGEDTGSDEGDNADGEDSEEAEGALDPEEMKAQLEDLELDELKEIAKEAGVTVKKGMKKDALIKALIADLDALDGALEALGYYNEEGEEAEGEDGEGDDEAGEEGESSLADDLNELELEDLVAICEEHKLSKKGKKQAVIDRIVEAVEEGKIDEADLFAEEGEDAGEDGEEGEGEDWYSEEELTEMPVKELEEIATENEVEIPKKKVKGKSVTDKVALIEAILALGEEGDGEVGEGEEGYTEDELADMTTKELEAIAEENELAIPTKKVKGKSVTDRAKLIADILNF